MSNIVKLPRKRRGADTDKVQVRVSPYLTTTKHGDRCDDARSRIKRRSGRSVSATLGVKDNNLLKENFVVVFCESPAHAVDLVNAINTTIPEGEVQAVLEGQEFPPWPQEIEQAKKVRMFRRR